MGNEEKAEITMVEACRKYGLDYSTVYNAANTITSLTTGYRGRLFDEEQLVQAIRVYLQRLIDDAQNVIERCEEKMKKLG